MWSYKPADLATSLLYQVRLAIGDTFENKKLFDDEELEYYLSSQGDNIYRAAARACEELAARFAREESVRTATHTADRSSISTKYLNMAKHFWAKATTKSSFFVPAISQADKDLNEEDTDATRPAIKRGIHDFDQLAESKESLG